MNKLKKELEVAINEYGEDHIDIVLDSETGFMYGSYHSLNDSFAVTNNYQLVRFSGIELADELNIGWSEN